MNVFYLVNKKNKMTVWELIERLKVYDPNYELEIQYLDLQTWNARSFPSLNTEINIYEDEEWYKTPRVIIDLWNV